MDAVIVIEDGARAICRKLRDVRTGDAVVCGVGGVRVIPEFQERDRHGFAFMTNEISSERRVEVGVSRIAAMMQEIKAAGGRIAVVAGPVVVHTGGAAYFQELIRAGYVDVLLAGNALAVHDVEQALFGTSLGVDLEHRQGDRGRPSSPHARDQHDLPRRRAEAAVEQGVLTSGVMYECIRHDVDYVLAGSIRDDGPLPDTIMDLRVAQDRYAAALQNVRLVLALSTMLHGIGVGNMLPSWVKMVCVDINPGGGHQAGRPRIVADDRDRDRRRAVPAPPGAEAANVAEQAARPGAEASDRLPRTGAIAEPEALRSLQLCVDRRLLCGLLGDELDPVQHLGLRRQLRLARREVCLEQDERQDVGVLLPAQAAGCVLRHRDPHPLEEIAERQIVPVGG